MTPRMERLARAYQPLRGRGMLVEGGWLQAPLRSKPAAPPARLTLAALLALVLRGGGGRS